ncbi:MAG: hypothetical protein GVY34_09875 [Alphaproteobacteria bacterium]|jgi:hypothetical protein|nr:hypothetical protein [Alphaproteobacteria bacterium]
MIFESWYWKRELADLVSEIQAWGPRHIQDRDEDVWGGESGFRVEKSLFQSAMVVRRLIDSHKVTDRLKGKSIPVLGYGAKMPEPHTTLSILGSVSIFEWFEMEKPEPLNMAPYNLASEILHSFTLEFIANDAGTNIDAFFVASERNQFVRAISIPCNTWVSILNSIIDDGVAGIEVKASSNGGDPKIELY